MSIATLTNACPSCGAEESMDVLLARMIEDADVRRLIADLVEKSMPLGGRVMRYLRLHKPAKQRMRMTRVHELLGELVTDITRGAITRKGREWMAPVESWTAGLEAVFEAVDRGTLTPPLQGNGYLYEVVLRLADRHEAEREREAEACRRAPRAGAASPAALGEVMADMDRAITSAQTAVDALANRLIAPPPSPTGPSAYARKLQAENAARQAARAAGNPDTDEFTDEERKTH